MRLEPMNLSLIHEDHGCLELRISLITGKNSVLKFSLEDLSMHFFFLGSTGTGKTNAIFQIVKILKNHVMTKNDVMVIFDTKGDYYREFYDQNRHDLVLSNDASRYDINNPEQIWNIFGRCRC